MAKFKETAMHYVFMLTACVSIAAVAVICVYLLANGIPTIAEIGLATSSARSGSPARTYTAFSPLSSGPSTSRPAPSW